jgi:hypothetical protein
VLKDFVMDSEGFNPLTFLSSRFKSHMEDIGGLGLACGIEGFERKGFCHINDGGGIDEFGVAVFPLRHPFG